MNPLFEVPPIKQMTPMLTKVELGSLQQLVEDLGASVDALRAFDGVTRERITAERERLRVTRRAVQKLHRLNKVLHRDFPQLLSARK